MNEIVPNYCIISAKTGIKLLWHLRSTSFPTCCQSRKVVSRRSWVHYSMVSKEEFCYNLFTLLFCNTIFKFWGIGFSMAFFPVTFGIEIANLDMWSEQETPKCGFCRSSQKSFIVKTASRCDQQFKVCLPKRVRIFYMAAERATIPYCSVHRVYDLAITLCIIFRKAVRLISLEGGLETVCLLVDCLSM